MVSGTLPNDQTLNGFRFERIDQVLLLVLGTILQCTAIFIVPLAYECDAAEYFNYNPSTTYRPPLYAIFLWVTGQHHLNSFLVTVIIQGIFGILTPILSYRILAPVSRWFALLCGLLLIGSTVPFTAAKLMLAAQLFMFVVVLAVYLYSRYQDTYQVRFIYLACLLGMAAFFTRWEGQFILWLVLGAFLLEVIRHRHHRRHFIFILMIVAISLTGWSYLRSHLSKNPALFGTLQNGTGYQLFWRIYGQMPYSVGYWELGLGSKNFKPEFYNPGGKYPIVQPDNGVSTRKLKNIIERIVTERPHDHVFRPYEYFKRFGGIRHNNDPKHLADEIVREVFENKNGKYVFTVPIELKREMGEVKSEKLLLEVAKETIKSHPTILLAMAREIMSFWGVWLSPKNLSEFNFLAYFFKIQGIYHYSNVPFNAGNCAIATLPKQMVNEYLWDQGLSKFRPLVSFTNISSETRNYIRNLVGFIAIFTWWAIIFSPYRLTLGIPALGAICLACVAGAMGGGALTRYEYAIFPLILIATVGSLATITFLTKKFWTQVYKKST